MNSLEIKKRAFMSVVTRRYGFIRTKSGAPPLTLTNCLSENLVDYKIFGNVGKNLIPYPYAETTKTVNGVTFTDNGDGSITVNGTATANAIFQLNKASTSIHVDKGERYRLSGAPTGGGTSTYLLLAYDTVNGYNDAGNGVVFAPKLENLTVSIRAYTGTTFDNLVFKPMLTKGGDVMEYEPYKAVGDKTKNLIPYPYAETTKTINGVTFTDNGDGSITVNGTATANAAFYIYREQKKLLNNLNTGDDFTVSVTADNTWSSSATMYLICNFYNSSGSMLSGGFVQSPDEAYRKKTIKISDEHFGMAVYLIVYNGKTINNVTVKPMIEKGVDVTEYEPYGYKIPITVGGKNLLDLPEKFTFESFESKKVNIPAGQYTVSWTSSILGGTHSPTLRLPDNAKSFPFAASGGSWKVTLTKPETIVYFYSNGYGLNDSTGVTSTVNGLMLELGEAATEYEPYKEPQTTNIFLNAPLGIGESIDYKTDNLPDIFVSEGTNIISAETKVKPSALEVKYRSSIEEG